MAHMTLPAEHSEADARLAERIGRALQLDEVHVFWTIRAPAAGAPRPTAAAGGTDPGAVGGLVGALVALLGRLVAQRR